MVSYKNVKYNENYLSDICDILSITEPILTSRDIDTLNIKSVDGEIFNGCKKNSYKIAIKVLIDGDNRIDYENKLQELKDIFDVKELKQFLKDEDKFILAIPDEEIEEEKINLMASICTISLFCPEPSYYSKEIKVFENEDNDVNTVIVTNEGKKPVYPLISIGFSKDAYFAQVELKSTGEKILVGKYPKLSLTSQTNSNRVLYNNCESVSDFIDSSASIDSDRTGGGNITTTSSGKGVCMSSPGTGETTWKGICKRLNLSKEVDEFELTCNMSHNSTGTNGDPTLPTYTDSKVVGSIKETYYVVSSSIANYRSGPGTNYKKYGTLKKNFEIYGGTVIKGWLKFSYKSKTCYVSTKLITEKVKVTGTIYEKNYVTYGSKGTTGVILRSQPKKSSAVVMSIKLGEVVRCNTKAYKDSVSGVTYYKLAKKYNGKTGYISTGNIKESGTVTSQKTIINMQIIK